jgi:hypothetical protein
MAVDLTITEDSLKEGIGLALRELIQKASDDLRRKVQTEVDWIARQTSELAISALEGNEEAMRRLDEMCLHAIQDAEKVSIREGDRLSKQVNLVASMSVKVIVATKSKKK